MMDVRRVIDARDALQRRLDRTTEEYGRLSRTGLVTSARQQAKLSRLAIRIEKLEAGIDRLNDLAADIVEGV